MIRFACPNCQATFTAPTEKAGKVSKCTKCAATFTIPAPYSPPPPVSEPRPLSPPPVSPPSANDPIEIQPCPKCQARLSVMIGDVGADIECPNCQTVYKATRTDAPRPPGADSATGPAKTSSKLVKIGSGQSIRDDDDEKPRRKKRSRDEDDDEDYTPKPVKRRRTGGRAPGTVSITRIAPLSFGLTLSLVYAILTLLFGLFGVLMAGCIGLVFGAQFGDSRVVGYLGAGVLMGLVYILVYAVVALVGGFIGGVLFAFMYNLIAKMTGGVEIDLE